jgi:hypothetical protein
MYESILGEKMKNLIAVGILLLGIALSIYVGFWCCFVGGVADVINAVKHDPVLIGKLGTGLLKFILAGPAGWFTFFVCMGIANATSK